jgi:hypothetical protein
MTSLTAGLYKSFSEASNAIRWLEKSGIPRGEIRVITSQNLTKEGIVEDPHSKAPEGFAIGAASGGTVGAIVAGISAAGAIATGGASLGLIAAGPVAAALAGAGAGAAAGSVVGGMVGAAIPEVDQKIFEQAIREGAVLIGVQTEDNDMQRTVKATLQATGAEKVT